MITVYFDGLCYPKNPGGVGEGRGMTNNVAEYEALMAAARWLVDEGIEDKIVIKGDSELVIKQMKGQYRVSSATSKKYVPEIRKLLEGKDVSFTWVPRKENEEADRLSRMGYESYLRHKKSGFVPTTAQARGRSE